LPIKKAKIAAVYPKQVVILPAVNRMHNMNDWFNKINPADIIAIGGAVEANPSTTGETL
jgi:hypothetical protein